jgi:hypothetical protein
MFSASDVRNSVIEKQPGLDDDPHGQTTGGRIGGEVTRRAVRRIFVAGAVACAAAVPAGIAGFASATPAPSPPQTVTIIPGLGTIIPGLGTIIPSGSTLRPYVPHRR